jgi:hypothetical protein
MTVRQARGGRQHICRTGSAVALTGPARPPSRRSLDHARHAASGSTPGQPAAPSNRLNDQAVRAYQASRHRRAAPVQARLAPASRATRLTGRSETRDRLTPPGGAQRPLQGRSVAERPARWRTCGSGSMTGCGTCPARPLVDVHLHAQQPAAEASEAAKAQDRLLGDVRPAVRRPDRLSSTNRPTEPCHRYRPGSPAVRPRQPRRCSSRPPRPAGHRVGRSPRGERVRISSVDAEHIGW